MSPKPTKMKCLNCGVEMNRHAEKIDYAATLKDARALDLEFGGVIEEFHTCPQCGSVATRTGGVR